tara:strand:- start:8 stop:1462 length:1455 start_codon:yes stop_codon:yes gene_type:complete
MESELKEGETTCLLEKELQNLIKKQRAAALSEGINIERRMNRIDRAISLLVENSEQIVNSLKEDFGHRSREGSLATDIFGTLSSLKYAKKNLRKWVRPSKRRSLFPLGLFGASTRIEYQPLGSVGVIVPWNFPFNLAFGPLGSIFAAGNRVVIKPSEFTSASSELTKRLVLEYFEEEEVSVVIGGPEVGATFCSQPFDHLLFTGSTSIAPNILRSAAENLVPVTLELGGKSPVIVSDTADLKSTAIRIMAGKTLNAGQICLAPDYLLVDKKVSERLVREIKLATKHMFPTMINNPDYSSIINQRHRDRLNSLLDDAERKGAELIELKPEGENFLAECQGKMPPYLVLSTSGDMLIMTDEIFGPILPLIEYDHIEEAISFINERPRPLGLYFFGSNKREAAAVVQGTVSGGVAINDVIAHIMQDDAPFGGVGDSGTGSYHGYEGFINFSHSKTVFTQTPYEFPLKITRPPYGTGIRRFLEIMIRK